MIKHKRILLAAGVLSALSAVAARADLISVTYQGATYPNYEIGQIQSTGSPVVGTFRSVDAGEFKLAVAPDVFGSSTLDAFCIDVNHWLVTPSAYYDIRPIASVSGDRLSLIGQLYDEGAGSLGDGLHDPSDSAAFQLALWEIMFEGDGSVGSSATASNFNFFSNGDFMARQFPSGTLDLANSWLHGLDLSGTPSGAYQFYEMVPSDSSGNLTPNSNQRLLVARKVPEPGTLALLGAGVFAFGFVRRRRENLHSI